jgi:hypothetical protein
MSTLYVDNLEPNLGSRVMAAGHVVQVVNGTLGSVALTSNSRVDVFSLSITPTSTSSKILAVVHLSDTGQDNVGVSYGAFWLMRDSTDIIKFTGQVGYTGGTASNSVGSCSTSYLDSPSTTSSVTYTVQGSNVSGTGTIEIGSSNSTSTITLMEIAQ